MSFCQMLCYCVISYVALLRSTTVNMIEIFILMLTFPGALKNKTRKNWEKYIISVDQCHFLSCWQVIMNKIIFFKCFSSRKTYTTIPALFLFLFFSAHEKVWPLICHLDGKTAPLLTPLKTVLLHSFLVLDVWFCFLGISGLWKIKEKPSGLHELTRF